MAALVDHPAWDVAGAAMTNLEGIVDTLESS
jgi:hypothetical protein